MASAHNFSVSDAVPLREGWRPVLHGALTLAGSSCQIKASAVFFPVVRVAAFREGLRPVGHGTPTLTEWPVSLFVLSLVLRHSARVGVPLFTGQ